MKLSKIRNLKGFTLIEILLVIAILSVLLVVVFASLRPQTRLQDTRDARRWNDVNQLLTAVHECIVDSDGATSTCTGSYTAGETYELVSGAVVAACDDVCTGVSADTNCLAWDTSPMSGYIASVPVDPGGAATDHSEYTVTIDSSGIITIAACSAEGGSTISVSR